MMYRVEGPGDRWISNRQCLPKQNTLRFPLGSILLPHLGDCSRAVSPQERSAVCVVYVACEMPVACTTPLMATISDICLDSVCGGR